MSVKARREPTIKLRVLDIPKPAATKELTCCLTEMLRTFSDNPTCRHIVFGGCHDAGYLLNLEHFKHNMLKASRITLLETTPAYRGFTDLANFKRARFDHVFKNEALPDYAPPPSNGFAQMTMQSPVLSSPSFARSRTSPAPRRRRPWHFPRLASLQYQL
jgi:hypothetical protein